MGNETRNNIIPFESLKRRSPKKPSPSSPDNLMDLLLAYQEQCRELFNLCVTSRVLLMECRDRCTQLTQQLEQERARRQALEYRRKRR